MTIDPLKQKRISLPSPLGEGLGGALVSLYNNA